jgi:3-hydroxy-9,10-secoandrosta-1,3,5(10)-triene-9,17-dione monooxygenase
MAQTTALTEELATLPTYEPSSAQPPATLTVEEALAAVDALTPQIIAEAAETEARSYHSPELHDAFVSAGFYGMFRPRTFGGYEFTPREFFAVSRQLARADMATAWCLTLAAAHNLQIASWWPEEVQREVFDRSYVASAMTSQPSGTLTRVDGGFIVEGTHRYGSGTPYSTHFAGHSRHAEDPSKISTFLAPRDTYEILDDWGHTLGLKGSGSQSVRFDGAFIPAAYVLEGVMQTQVDVADGTPGLRLHGNPIYGGRAAGFLGTELTNLAIGGVLGAFDLYGELMPVKRTTVPPFALRTEDVDYLRVYGLAAAKLDASVASIERAADLILEFSTRAADGGDPFSMGEDLRIHTLAQQAGELAWEAMHGYLFQSAGTSASSNGQRFERSWRDVSMWWGHANTILKDWAARWRASEQFSSN